ncbi:Nn.00g019590.m01.CDS01 [Neocucurbitaria sp. VM-36]
MSGAVTTVARLKPEIRLAQAVSQFEASLSSDQKIVFRDQRSQSLQSPPNTNDVMRLTAQMSQSQQAGGRCFGPRFTKFLHGVQQFAALGDVIVGGSQNIIACGATVNHSTYLESLSLLLMEAGRSIPQHYELSALYPRSKALQANLIEYFIIVVQICHHFQAYTRKSVLRKIASSLNDADLKEFQSRLASWSKSIGEEMQSLLAHTTEEEAQKNSRFRALMTKSSKATSQQQKLNAFQRILNRCSGYDYETTWRQIRRIGNTTIYSKPPEYNE